MNREELFYLIPYLFSLALSLSIVIYTWRHREVRGAWAYAWFVGGQTLTILGFIFELVSPTLAIKILWDKFQWLTDSFLVILPFLIFSVQFSEHKLRYPRLAWGTVLTFASVFTAFLLTDDSHHLIYPNPHLSADYPFPELQYDFTTPAYIYALFYFYGANFFGISLLINRAIRPYNAHRLQYWTVAFGFLITLILSFFSLMDIRIAPQRDIAPFSFAVGNLVVAWGLFRYGLFDIVPIARERIVENMSAAVVVLDTLDRIIDVNSAALQILGKNRAEVISKSNQSVFSQWPGLVARFRNVGTEERLELTAKVRGETRHYDVSLSPISDNRERLLGRTLIIHDMTKRKILEDGYRQLSEELERRVYERTEELHKSMERYRAVVENQTEFIVRWKANGLRTFVNDAYCRHFGLTPQQVLATSFVQHVAEDDRRAIEEKMSRLTSGLVSVETDIHRVVNPDGSVSWQEWTDQAIRDESGNLIEFQSVGRDITQRKRAEENLAETYDTTLEGWARALELRDKETEGHSRRVTEITLAVARAMGIQAEALEHIRRGAILHDIGKMGIPDHILRKAGPLTDEEREIVSKHPETAYNLLEQIPYLEKALEIPYCHHEKWNGSGYPRGLKEREIPLSARIFAVVDVWDALSFDRPYRKAWEREEVIRYLSNEAGKHFDPHIVNVFLNLVEKGKIAHVSFAPLPPKSNPN